MAGFGVTTLGRIWVTTEGIGWLRSGFACLTSVMVLESVIRLFSNVFLPGGALRHPKVLIEDNVASPN
jgi:hypothetical protein